MLWAGLVLTLVRLWQLSLLPVTIVPHGKELVKMLRDAVPGLKSVVQNINKKQTNIVMGN